MPILANPDKVRVSIPVGDAKVILILRAPTAEEQLNFLAARFKISGKKKVVDNSTRARIDFIDLLLAGIEALDEEGNADYVEFKNPAAGSGPSAGRNEKLTAEIPGWKSHVNNTWKLAAAMQFESELNAGEIQIEKN